MQNFIICAANLEGFENDPCLLRPYLGASSDALGILIIIACDEYQRSSNTIHSSLSINKLLALEHLLDSIGRVLAISSCLDNK
jgi:hypothetical protein